jgi:hypothetical protein
MAARMGNSSILGLASDVLDPWVVRLAHGQCPGGAGDATLVGAQPAMRSNSLPSTSANVDQRALSRAKSWSLVAPSAARRSASPS